MSESAGKGKKGQSSAAKEKATEVESVEEKSSASTPIRQMKRKVAVVEVTPKAGESTWINKKQAANAEKETETIVHFCLKLKVEGFDTP